MSATLFRQGSIEPPESTLLTTTNATAVMTASDKFVRVVEAILLANVDASNACIVTLEWRDATPTDSVFWHGEVPAKSTVTIDAAPLLTDGKGKVRSIRATAASANDIWVTVVTSVPQRTSQ